MYISMQGSFVLFVQVLDADDILNDIVDVMVVERTLDASLPTTQPTTYMSRVGVFAMVVSFDVQCSESEYTAKS